MSQRRSHKGSPSKAVAYLRVSTDRQDLGLDVQSAGISQWASSKGVEVVASFTDEAVSGGTALSEREGLRAALKALREYKAGILVALKRDRFARDGGLMSELERLVGRKGAVLRTADGASDGAGFAGAVQRESMDFLAKLERLAIRDRTSGGLRRKLEKGEAPGGNPPYGWRIVKTPDSTDERGWRRMLEEEPAEQSALRLIVELDSQGLSWAEIARRVAAAGYAPRGTRWHPRTVQRLFHRFRNVPRPGGRPETT